MGTVVHGALAGWKRRQADNGCVVTLQIAASAEAFRAGHFDRVDMALNDRQLRSLTRDLNREVAARGLDLRARAPRWWEWHRLLPQAMRQRRA